MPQPQAPVLSVAPMEGLTTVVFRRVHAAHFGAAPLYYLPFVTPTIEPRFTSRQIRELAPEQNAGLAVVPQLLTRRAADFIWAAKALADMGYREVNLNLGCPAGTVTAKGKGSGFLTDPLALSEFFETVFAEDLGIAVSVKTRLGWSSEEEFAGLTQLFARFPIVRLIVHARLKTDLYKGAPRWGVLEESLSSVAHPLGVNGDVVSVSDIDRLKARFSGAPAGLAEIMIGRALFADPALIAKAAGGAAATARQILAFHRDLFESYTAQFESRKNALMRMKEYWFYQLNLFAEVNDSGRQLEKCAKAMFRAKEPEAFDAGVEEVCETFPVLETPRFGWRKPL